MKKGQEIWKGQGRGKSIQFDPFPPIILFDIIRMNKKHHSQTKQ